MDLESWGIAFSLGILCTVLGSLSVRGFVRFFKNHDRHQVMWAVGLGLGTAATLAELLAYVGVVSVVLLQSYVFFSAAIVGVLSLGTLRAFHRVRWNQAYIGYIGATLALVAFYSFTTPMPTSMVTSGVISGNPPLSLLILSSLVTVPATIVLLSACVLSLRKSFRWRGLLMLSGACVLGAGGAFYIASFPVMLYYAEFVGIVLLFFGLVDFSRWTLASPTAAPRPQERTA
ncbi:MAG: hypothetical protein ABSB97_02645 [Thermoplasmata archaeon]